MVADIFRPEGRLLRDEHPMPGMRYRTVILVIVAFASHQFLAANARAFDCVELTCPQLQSCTEATYKVYACGHGARDADDDAIPCEKTHCDEDFARYREAIASSMPDLLPKIDATRKEAEARILARQALAEASHRSILGLVANAPGLKCDGKRTCKQMASCEEAKHYLTACAVTSLDRDGDGIPCNKLCGRR